MTTIAYRDGILAADTAIFDRGVYCGATQKIVRAPDGTMGGGAGALGEVKAALQWIKNGATGDPPKLSDDSEVIVIRPDGSVWWLGSGSEWTQINAEYVAIGSGFRIALGAMAAGATAQRAIEICADLDNMTRRPICIERLGQ